MTQTHIIEPTIGVLGLGNIGQEGTGMLAGARDAILNSIATEGKNPGLADKLRSRVIYAAGNTQHPTLGRVAAQIPGLYPLYMGGTKITGGANSLAEASEAFEISKEKFKNLFPRAQAWLIGGAAGGNTCAGSIEKAISMCMEAGIAVFPFLYRPSKKDGTSLKKIRQGDELIQRLREQKLPYFEICTSSIPAIAQKYGWSRDRASAWLLRQGEFALGAMISILYNYGNSIDERRFCEFYDHSMLLTVTHKEIPVAQIGEEGENISRELKAFYDASWVNDCFTTRDTPDPAKEREFAGVMRAFHSNNPGKYQDRLNEVFAKLDENNYGEQDFKIHTEHGYGGDPETATVTVIGFVKGDTVHHHNFSLFGRSAAKLKIETVPELIEVKTPARIPMHETARAANQPPVPAPITAVPKPTLVSFSSFTELERALKNSNLQAVQFLSKGTIPFPFTGDEFGKFCAGIEEMLPNMVLSESNLRLVQNVIPREGIMQLRGINDRLKLRIKALIYSEDTQKKSA